MLPILGAVTVPRPHLVNGPTWHAPVVLVTSQAGSGKTTLLVQRTTLLRERGQTVAWVSVEDDHVRRGPIWMGLSLSISKALVEAGQPELAEAVGALRVMDPEDHHGVAMALAGLLSASSRPLTVVLDDTHLIAPGVEAESLFGLISATVPAVNYVLGGRWDPPFPMSGLKLRGQLGELRAADLAFASEDATALLSRHGVEVDEVAVKALVERTEGLAACLQLAAMALSQLPSDELRADYLDSFTGDHRPVAEFLVSEVLGRVDPATMALMIATAVPEQVPVGLAAELTGRSDAGAVLDRLAAANALVYRIDGPDPVYRYHTLLRSYLNAEGARSDLFRHRELHRTTAAWAERNGHAEEAISHCTQAEDWPALMRLLVGHGVSLVLRGQGLVVQVAIDTLPPEARLDTDILLLGVVRAALAGDRGALADGLSRVELSEFERDSGRRHALRRVGLIADAILSGSPSAISEPSFAEVRGAIVLDVATRALVLSAEGRFAAFLHNFGLSQRLLTEAYALAAEQGFDLLALECLSFLVLASAGRGQVGELRHRTQQALRFGRARGWLSSPVMAGTYGVGAWGAWIGLDDVLVGELAVLAEGVRGATQPQAALGCVLHRALLEHGRTHDLETLRRSTRQAWADMEPYLVAPQAYVVYAVSELGVAIGSGKSDWVQEILERSQQLLSPDELVHLRHGCELASASRSTPVHLDPTPPPLSFTASYAWTWSRLVAVGALLDRGRHVRAHEVLLEVLEVASPLEFRRPFLDAPESTRKYLVASADRLVRWHVLLDPVLAAVRAQASGATVAKLTPRELQLLAELGSHLTLREIADVLGIGENTVRTHLKSVYHKLGVTRRREALAKAGQLGLYGPH